MLPRRLLALAIAAMIALIATGFISDRTVRIMRHAVLWVDHSRDVLLSEGRCRVSLLSAESSARAYVLTGSPRFEHDYMRAAHDLRSEIDRIVWLTRDNSAQQKTLTSVRVLAERRIALLDEVVRLRRQNAPEPDVNDTVLAGAALTRSLDRAFDQIRAEELKLLDTRGADAERAHTWATYAPWLMALIAATVAAALLAEVIRALREERAARTDSEEFAARERAARLRAEASDRLKDEFLTTLSHELRTPLTTIVGWSAVLADSQMRSHLLDDGLRSIDQAARVQSRLIEDLLDMSRVITGKMRIDLSMVDLGTIVGKVIASIAPSAEAKEIALSIDAESDVKVVGDPDRLQQVLWNLLSNAVKFTPRGGRIEVDLRRVGANVHVSVSDTGEGMAAEFLPHVFDRFRQADSGPTRRSGGIGLGLSIVKQLVELHGGSVRAESAGLGKGSTFTIELPVTGAAGVARTARSFSPPLLPGHPSAEEAPAQEFARPLYAPPRLRGRRIVLVEDDPPALDLFTTILRGAGAEVFTATKTADALQLLASQRVDMLLCDVGLPDEDGISFIRRLRGMTKPFAGIAAIALTAFARPEDRSAALSAGFDSYLAKPLTPDELLAAVDAALA